MIQILNVSINFHIYKNNNRRLYFNEKLLEYINIVKSSSSVNNLNKLFLFPCFLKMRKQHGNLKKNTTTKIKINNKDLFIF